MLFEALRSGPVLDVLHLLSLGRWSTALLDPELDELKMDDQEVDQSREKRQKISLNVIKTKNFDSETHHGESVGMYTESHDITTVSFIQIKVHHHHLYL